MAEVVLFHHALGLTDGVRRFAHELRSAGHIVHTPDYFYGQVFETMDEGIAHLDEVGFQTLHEQAIEAAKDLGPEVVYAGFSLGVSAAQRLAQSVQGAKGALLFEGCLPASAFGEWPANVPAQIHGSTDDPFFDEDLESAQELAGTNENIELFLYSGAGHLFNDSSAENYNEQLSSLVLERTIAFLSNID